MMNEMQYIKMLLLAVAGSVIFSACEKENDIGKELNSKQVTFSMYIPDAETTRALTDVHENQIEGVYILLFDPVTDKLVQSIPVSQVQNGSQSNIKYIETTLPTGTFDLTFVANCNAEVAAKNFAAATDRETIVQDLLKTVSVFGISDTTAVPFPMWGEYKGLTVDGSLTNEVTIYMLRGVVRIDVRLADSFLINMGGSPFINLVSVRLYNRYTKTQVIPTSGNLTGQGNSLQAIMPSLPSGEHQQLEPLVYLVEGDDKMSLTATIYTFESHKGSFNDMLKNTCLVIGIGDEDKHGGGITNSMPGQNEQIRTRANTDFSTRYYRVDFMEHHDDQSSYMPLVRNYIYDVEVKSARSMGFETPDEAFYAESYELEYTVQPYIIKHTGSYTPGNYYKLEISQTDVYLETLGPSKTITLWTNHPKGLSLNSTSTNPNLSITPDDESKLSIPETTVTLTLTALGPPSWITYFYVTAGNMEATVRVHYNMSVN